MDDFSSQGTAYQQELPSGIVTFLFTDIEGSTRLWEEAPNEVIKALSR
jgi:class 3 adenylate cyclase